MVAEVMGEGVAADGGSALAVRARAGDRSARDALWLREAGYLRPKAASVWRRWARTSPAAAGLLEVEDAEQEAYLIYLAILAQWDPAAGVPFGPFLNRRFPFALRDRLHSLAGSTRRVPDRVHHLPEPSEAETDATGDAEMGVPDGTAASWDGMAAGPDVVAGLIDRLVCSTAARSLTPPQRRLLALHFGEGLPLGQIAHLLGVSPHAAHRRLRRALAVLRLLMPSRLE